MGRKQGPRKGSLQFWPRKRVYKQIPRANWKALNKDGTSLLGFIGYKVGMKSAYVKNLTNDSMTKGKKIAVPVTVIECPSLKILSVRFYKNKKVMIDVLNDNIDKEVKKLVKLPKTTKTKEAIDKIVKEGEFDDVTLIVYSQVKKTNIKKRPNISEIGLSGKKEEKIAFIKENLPKELSVLDTFKDGLVDVRGVTTGKGFQGPVKRFGISLRFHKSEKGIRRVGSIGPWHPTRVTFRVPMAGQMGMANRLIYNNIIISVGKIDENNINPKSGFKKYGVIKSDYLIIKGNVQGPSKRQVLITHPLRSTKKTAKQNYEFIELR